MTSIQSFHIDIPDETLDRIRARVADYPWHEMPDDGGWEYGTNLDYMKELCAYWVEAFDWRKQEAAINRFCHFIAPVDGIDIHFIHEKGTREKSGGPAPLPLIISHGWPGTIVEFLDFIEPLAHPERFGGNAEDAFDVVAPSLPGFGFSGRPPRPYGPRKIAGATGGAQSQAGSASNTRRPARRSTST
jgi:microsomal epoxide hydrolase